VNVKCDVKETIGPFPFISAAEMTHAQTTESTVDLRQPVKAEKKISELVCVLTYLVLV
jgi:hypothetical protein